jgi:hypothetical protein
MGRQVSFTHKISLPKHIFKDQGIVFNTLDFHSPRANDRRRAIKLLYGSWFADHQLKLGRDYQITFEQKKLTDNLPGEFLGWWIIITFHDDDQALLFKLTWGGIAAPAR